MKLHLVGGFLGSGKTTAIIHAAQHLILCGQRVGIITNDQGKYLVDTAFFKAADLPTIEVTGGCFCCNYNDLESVLKQLEAHAQPEVIFPESVGSCADLVATVVKPLREFYAAGLQIQTLSVFADSRLLHRRLLGLPMPFAENVIYIFDKQIEEAGTLIINKADLLSAPELQETCDRAHARYPDKHIISQTSLQASGVQNWVEHLASGSSKIPDQALAIDYERYGAGEAALAWLDEELTVETEPGSGQRAVVCLLENLLVGLAHKGCPIGHLKVWLKTDGCECKISLPTLAQPGWQNDIPFFESNRLHLLINARVQAPVFILQEVFLETLEILRWTTRAVCTKAQADVFAPAQPEPTHRLV